MTNPTEQDEPLRAAVVAAVQNFLAATRTGSFCLNEALPGKLILAGDPAKLRLLLGMAIEDAPALPAAEQPADSSMPRDMSEAKRWITQLRARIDSLLDVINAPAAPAPESQPAAPSLPDQAAAYIRTGINRAASYIEKQAAEYLDQHASTEPDTGAVSWHYGDAGRDHHSTLVELAEEIRALAAPAMEAP